MPQETGYTRQVGPRAAAAMPLASPDSFGAGVGRQLEAAGGQIHREAIEDYKLERERTRQEQWAQFQHGFALHRENMTGIAREARKAGEPGHAGRMGEAWEAARESLLDGISDDEVRRQATAQFEDTGGRFRIGEAEFEDVAGVNRSLLEWGSARDIAANRIRRLEKPEDYPAELELGRKAIAGFGLPDEQERKALAEWDDDAGVAFIQGTIDRDPKLARAMMDQGLFDEVDPGKLEVLRNGADVEIRRQEAAAEHTQNVAVAALREQVRVATAKSTDGVDVSGELPVLEAAARQLGLPDVAEQLHGLAADATFARIFEPQTPLQREQRLRSLETKGDKRSDDEDRELKWLEDHAPALDSRFNANPADHFVRNGGVNAPPPLDFANPQSLAARAQWARAASAASGRPVPPLTSNEAKELGANWQTGQTGTQRGVLEALAQFPADQAVAAARLVDPSDARLPVMATLGPRTRELALLGRDVLKANPKLLHSDDPDTLEAMQRYDAGLAEALHVFPPAQRAAIKDVAARILAGIVDQNGGELSGTRYLQALNMAVGATWAGPKMLGGVATWGDHWFAVPPGMHKDEFAPAVGRAIARSGIKPVNPDKSPADLSRAFPVFVGAGQYEFHTADGRAIAGSNGTAFRVKLP